MNNAKSQSGNNPIDLADKAVERGENRGTKSLTVGATLHRIGEGHIPTALENYSAWERERSLGRGLKEIQKRGNMAVRVRVKSNSHRGKTEIIDDLVLHFNKEGWATIPAGEAYKVEAFAAKRPGRMSVVRDEVESTEDLLAAAQAAMAAVAEEAAPAEPEEAPAPPVEVPTERQAAAELGLDMTQVEEADVPPHQESKPSSNKKVHQESKSSSNKKANKKKE